MCEHCQVIEANHPDFAFCPYCGKELTERRKVREAINTIIDYCDNHNHDCLNCVFFDDDDNLGCLFKNNETKPAYWDEY